MNEKLKITRIREEGLKIQQHMFAEDHTTKLSLAIYIWDDYTDREPIGAINLSIKGNKCKPIKNLSSFFIFQNLIEKAGDGNYTLQMSSEYYLDEDLDFKIENGMIEYGGVTLDPKSPVIKKNLKPNPHYPFPYGTTLIRGVLYRFNEPVSGVEVSIEEKDMRTKTSEDGEFVLYFRPDEVKGDESFQLKIEHDKKEVKNLEVKEGRTFVLE